MPVMNFVRVCSLDDLWEGDMAVFDANGHEVLLVHAEGRLDRGVRGRSARIRNSHWSTAYSKAAR